MERHHKVLAACFGAISALGPLAMDMYLAAMPSMAAHFGAEHGRIELSVMAFFVGFCLGQLVLGPVSDRTGRKPVVLIGIALYCAASLGCMVAGSLNQLIFWRVVQGVGGSVGMVIAMASIRDLFTGAMAARLLSMVVMVLGLAPVIAPILGSAILMVAPWQVIFATLAGLSGLVLLAVFLLLPETRSPEARAMSHPTRALGTYAMLLFRKDYIPYAGTMAIVQGGFFGYIAVASVVLMSVYGLSPMAFALVFASNALGLAICSRICGGLTEKLGAVRITRRANLFRAVVGLVLGGWALTGTLPLVAFVVLCFLLVASLGFVMPSCSVLSLERQGQHAGAAAALMGALGFGAGAVVSALAGMLADGTAMPISVLLSGSAILAFLLSALTFSADMETTPQPAR